MIDLVTMVKDKAIFYWGIILYVLLFSASGLATCILGALVGTQWNTLDGQSKFMICLTVFINWSTIMMAFFSKAANRLKSGDIPISPDDTNIIAQQTKQITTATQTTVQQTLGASK